MKTIKGSVDLQEKELRRLPDLTGIHVIGGFFCYDNQLTSLEGSPESVKGVFSCHTNSLTSLEGAQKKVGYDFYCHRNSLSSLVGAPKEVDGSFYCPDNKTKFTEEDVRKVCKVCGNIYT